MSLPSGLWSDEQSVSGRSTARRRLRLVLFTADSSRMLLALNEELCWVVGVVTPAEYRPGRPRDAPWGLRLLHGLRRTFAAPTALESVAAELHVPLLRAWRLDMPEFLARLRRLEPDVFVVAGYPEIFAPSVLAIPRHGCINVHASLLPRYRGPQPVAQALLHGEPYTGVTVHMMNERVDAGDILAQDVVPILDSDTVYTLAARLFELGGRLLVDVLERLALGTLQRRPQEARRATRHRRLGPKAGRIDWTRPALEIERLARLSPWLEVYTRLGRHKLIVLAARRRGEAPAVQAPEGSRPEERKPGQILLREGRGLIVMCGDGGRIAITEWKLAGRWPRRLWARRRLRAGSVLDPGLASDPSGREERERNSTPTRPNRPPATTSRTPRSSWPA
jgi:methionyl-tRNA formyltransferase